MSDIVRDAIAASLVQLVQVARTPSPPLNYGADLVCVDDLDARLAETDPNSLDSIAQDAYHRITTQRGTLPDDPDYGRDVRAYLSGPTDPVALLAAGGELESEISKDDRVSSVTVDLRLSGAKTLLVTVQIEPSDPALDEFDLIITVTDGATFLEIIR